MIKVHTARFEDIRKFTRSANYCVTIEWIYLERQIESESTQHGAKLDLEPDFQRAHVWDMNKRARYVEYILRNGQSARDIYFNCAGWMQDFRGPYVCVDGKQRIEAVRSFMRNDFPVFFPEFGGETYFGDFTDRLRGAHCYFNWHVNDLATRAEVLQWYLDMNSGGVLHTPAELNRVRKLLNQEETK